MVMTGRRTSTEQLGFFPNTTKKASKQRHRAALSLAEKFFWLWVWKEKPQKEREGVTLSESSVVYFLWQQSEFKEALPQALSSDTD